MKTPPPRIELARTPTPLQRLDRLSEAWGGPTLWAKRDDLTGFGVSGNKVRKLEYHLAAAREAGADTIITCGAAQSNHCRTTALACAALGLDVVLVLRTPDGGPPATPAGNHLLDLLAGAATHYVSPADYRRRDDVMAAVAADLTASGRRTWIVPEGASDALGMWGFVTAMEELVGQHAVIGGPYTIWHAASSAGTVAGMGWATDRLGLDLPVVGASVGETAAEVWDRVDTIWSDAVAAHGGMLPAPAIEILDDYLGLGYGRTTTAELQTQAEVTRLTGMILDPTYTGKAAHALKMEIAAGRFSPSDQVVFWHTGGGFAVFGHDFSGVLT